ncbi:hypothetical protein [Comamonas endophytica]|uniref:Uncharacterized protein n=1 Tax=Comamonas endophytica TaxID=2949090 RepID=A0ABY6GA63_9BURK|nr:hypothetical protein [Acidovorax sp. 5MLIR]UYG51786.1 hypothetical protein M9799_00580 [Acidovorax sp. 5MLIR]
MGLFIASTAISAAPQVCDREQIVPDTDEAAAVPVRGGGRCLSQARP